MKKLSLVHITCIMLALIVSSKAGTQTDNEEHVGHYFVGSTLWVLYDKLTTEPAGFYQLSCGYKYSKKDIFFAEAITWEYNEPLGTYENSEKRYPGKIRSFGIGAGYQRFLWKKSFATIQATPFVQQFYDKSNNKIQKGFQLYCQLFLGYRFEFFNNKIFFDPACALKYWPVNINLPDSFAIIEKGKPKYIFEPSLKFGVVF